MFQTGFPIWSPCHSSIWARAGWGVGSSELVALKWEASTPVSDFGPPRGTNSTEDTWPGNIPQSLRWTIGTSWVWSRSRCWASSTSCPCSSSCSSWGTSSCHSTHSVALSHYCSPNCLQHSHPRPAHDYRCQLHCSTATWVTRNCGTPWADRQCACLYSYEWRARALLAYSFWPYWWRGSRRLEIWRASNSQRSRGRGKPACLTSDWSRTHWWWRRSSCLGPPTLSWGNCSSRNRPRPSCH